MGDDCEDEMSATRSEFGEPDRITDAPHDGVLRLASSARWPSTVDVR